APAHRRDDRQPDAFDPRRRDPRHLGRPGSAHPDAAGQRPHRPRRRVGHPAVQQHPVTLNPARLARFTDWAKTLPPRPLPRTVTPWPASITSTTSPGSPAPTTWSSQSSLLRSMTPRRSPSTAPAPGTTTTRNAWRPPRARLARLYWPAPRVSLRAPEGFPRMLRPASHRCPARYGIPGPVACSLPPPRTVCRRPRLWTGPAATS